MQLTPVIAIHLAAALGAVALGPVVLWTRQGRRSRPRLHRALGYAWVTLMLATALSALFIRDFRLPNLAGYTPIHLLVPLTLVSLFGAFWMLARGNVAGHRSIMRKLYFGACIVAGAFTLLPGRYLGDLLWAHALGLLPPGQLPGVVLRQLAGAMPPWAWTALAILPAALLLRRLHASRALS